MTSEGRLKIRILRCVYLLVCKTQWNAWVLFRFTFSYLADALHRGKCLAQGHNVVFAPLGIELATFWLIARLPNHSAILSPVFVWSLWMGSQQRKSSVVDQLTQFRSSLLHDSVGFIHVNNRFRDRGWITVHEEGLLYCFHCLLSFSQMAGTHVPWPGLASVSSGSWVNISLKYLTKALAKNETISQWNGWSASHCVHKVLSQ